MRVLIFLVITASLSAAHAAVPVEKRGSLRLLKGKVIVLQKARPGRALKVMVGKGLPGTPEAVKLPAMAYAWKTLVMEATAYDPGPSANGQDNESRTFTGARARFGVVAVDPAVIPMKSLLYVEGYGPAQALDTGGDIKGMRIDLCFNSTHEARAWGRKKTRVFVLSGMSAAERDKVLEALKK